MEKERFRLLHSLKKQFTSESNQVSTDIYKKRLQININVEELIEKVGESFRLRH